MAAAYPPGPAGGLIRGALVPFESDPLGFLMRIHQEHGPLVHFRLGPVHTYSLIDPDHIDYVLVRGNKNFIKSSSLRRGRPLLGNGLLVSEGDFWLRQRRLMQPAFHRDRIAAYSQYMVEYAVRMLAGWQDGTERDIHGEMTNLTMSIVTKALFDVDISAEAAEIGHVVEQALAEWTALTWRIPFTDWLPLPGNLRFKRAVRRVESVIYRIIEQRRQSPGDRGDLLSMLLAARDEDGSPMTNQQLRDEVITLFGAGHETTATSLSWTWYQLAQHPEVEARLAAELHDVLQGRTPSLEDLPRLPYTHLVVQESMRIYPPAWIVGREAIADCEVGGYPVRKGAMLLLPQWVAHRNPAYFPEPEAFRPERWEGGLEKRLPTYAYFPFGGGPRVCIGKQFALMEAVLILAAVAQRYRLALLPGQTVLPDPQITVRPKGGLPMRLTKR